MTERLNGVDCPLCLGGGQVPGWNFEAIYCPDCHGWGWVSHAQARALAELTADLEREGFDTGSIYRVTTEHTYRSRVGIERRWKE